MESWTLEIPRIELATSLYGKTNGEQRGIGLCQDIKSFDHPFTGGTKRGTRWDQTHFTLLIPNEGPKQLLFKNASATQFPSDAKYITQDNWYVRCVASHDPNGATQTFEAVSPTGTIYTFDEIGREPLTSNWWVRGHIRAFVTQIKNVHGNWLKYNYERVQKNPSQWRNGPHASQFKPFVRPYLNQITSSDGQSVSLTYENLGYKKRLKQITANKRYWHYRYSAPTTETFPGSKSGDTVKVASHLVEVEAPGGDKTRYGYSLINHQDKSQDWFATLGLINGSVIAETDYRGFLKLLTKVTTPQGLVIDYEYERCDNVLIDLPDGGKGVEACWPSFNFKRLWSGSVSALSKRTLSGRGLTPIVWKIRQVPSMETLKVYANYQHLKSRQTIFEMPEKTLVNHYHMVNVPSPADDWKHGALVKREIFKPGVDINQGSPLYREAYVHAKGPRLGEDGIYYGRTPAYVKARALASWGRQLVANKTVTLDGKTFSTQYKNYDQYGFPRQIVESGTQSRTNNITYEHKTSRWIIGLTKESRIVNGPWIKNTFNSLGLVTQSDHDGEVELFEYYANGHLMRKKWYKDSVNDIQSILYENYKRGLPQRETHPENVVITKNVDQNGFVSWQKDPQQNQTNYVYDPIYRLKTVKYPLHSDKNVTWSGWQSKTTANGNHRLKSSLNALGEPYLTESWDVNEASKIIYQRRTFDAYGNLLFESRPSLNKNELSGIRYQYDPLGRLSQVTDTAINKSTHYYYGPDANQQLSGHPVKVNFGYLVIDPKGYRQVFNYHAFGNPDEARLSQAAMQSRLQSEGGRKYVTTDIQWTPFGKIKSVKQAGVTKSYTYYTDRPYLLKNSSQPEATTHFVYDLAGNLVKKRVGDSPETLFTYDDLNRLTGVNYPGSTPDVITSYDSNSNVKTVTRGNIGWTYDYNQNNQPVAEKLRVGSQELKLGYVYDAHGLLSEITYPTGRKVKLSPNGFGQPTQLSGYASNISYHPNGKVSSFAYGNGLKTERVFNSRQLPHKINLWRNSLIDSQLSYDYDYNNNIKEMSLSDSPGFYRQLFYDGFDRLIKANGNGWKNGTIVYDDLGNIKIKNMGTHSLTYQYNSKNQLSRISGSRNASFQYDIYGNVSHNGSNGFDYGHSNELIKVTGPNAATYAYDGNGKRVIVTRGGKTEYSFYNRDGVLMHKYNATDKTKTDYVYLQKELVAKLEGEPGSVIAPGRPPTISAPASSSTGDYNVTWGSSNGATYYVLQEKINAGHWITRYSGSHTSKLILYRPDGQYQYRAQACNQGGCSAYIESGIVRVEHPKPLPPAPANLTSPSLNKTGHYYVTWNAVSVATRYELQEKNNSGSWRTVQTNNFRSFNATNKKTGSYHYRVRACNSQGCGAYSGTVTTKVFIKIIPPCKTGLRCEDER